jgi:predicted Zn-dependent peptidase
MKIFINKQSAISKIYVLTFLLLSFVFSASAQAGGQPTQAQANLISDFDVNGLKVIVKRRTGAPTVSAGLFIRGGVRNLTADTAGIESLMLSTATEASKKFPRGVMRKELTKMASSLSYRCGDESVVHAAGFRSRAR